jgi:hypothetical protein
MNKRTLHFIVIVGLLMIFGSGCATMIRGTEETLQITSEPAGALAELSSGQKCNTPCGQVLKRNQTVLIKFSKEGYHDESVTVYPTLAGAGVILGGIIDYGTGAVYSLTPNPVHVILKPTERATKPRESKESKPLIIKKPPETKEPEKQIVE